MWKKILKRTLVVLLILAGIFYGLSIKKDKTITYGVSFSKFHSDELRLNYKDVLTSALDDLRIRNFRISAFWPEVEGSKNNYDYSVLDYEMKEISARDGKVVLAVGRRLPGWPECHIPEWAKGLSWEEQKKEILAYIEKTVNRYKDSNNILYWQVENEPYLTVFAHENCGDLDHDFLAEEIALVKRLDPRHQILVTDSGNLGLWYGAWRSGDAFGTSVYMYLWNDKVGEVKSFYQPSFYRAKASLMSLVFGQKENMLIELSLEPWLLQAVIDTPMKTQLERMDAQKFDEIVGFARDTNFSRQYLWGLEWWYYMKEHGRPEFWQKAKVLFLGKE